MIGLGGLILIALAAILASSITRHSPYKQMLLNALLSPSLDHPFGTDHFGRDVFSRVIYGARISLRIGFISVGIASAGGIPLGLLSGYYSGWFDMLIQRLVDILLSFPGILLALAVMTVLGPGLNNAMIAVGVSIMPQYIRISRASTLSIKEMDYMTAARGIGASDAHLIRVHIFPNALLPLIVLTSLQFATAILFAAGLSFLGLGAQPPSPEWGAMLTVGRVFMRQAWWITIFPGCAIMLTVLSMNLLGDGLRDAMDPSLITCK
jgi:peptide/nickel transport system permease protein